MIEKTVSEKIDYLFKKINWRASFLDAEAIQIMNNLKLDIHKEKLDAINKLIDDLDDKICFGELGGIEEPVGDGFFTTIFMDEWREKYVK